MKQFLAIITLCTIVACEDGGPTSSTSFGPGGLPSVSEAPSTPATPSVTPVNPGADVPDGEASLSDIEIVGLNRAGIRVTARCSGVTFYVPATGADYVNVWVPEMFGVKYGPNPVNEEFTIYFEPGTYQYQLAVEARTGDPNHPIAQDDRHRSSFTVTCSTPPPPPPVDVCPNIEGNQSEVPRGLVVDEAGNCVEPEPDCEQVWVVDKEAYDETIVVVDQEAYEEDVTTCTPQDPLPGEPIITGYIYKTTGGDKWLRDLRCAEKGGSVESTTCIPGQGEPVDACVFDEDKGEEFTVGLFNPKTKFRFECERTIPGEPIPQPDLCVTETIEHPAVTHEETIHHDEVGHFEQICEGDEQ